MSPLTMSAVTIVIACVALLSYGLVRLAEWGDANVASDEAVAQGTVSAERQNRHHDSP